MQLQLTAVVRVDAPVEIIKANSTHWYAAASNAVFANNRLEVETGRKKTQEMSLENEYVVNRNKTLSTLPLGSEKCIRRLKVTRGRSDRSVPAWPVGQSTNVSHVVSRVRVIGPDQGSIEIRQPRRDANSTNC